MQDNKSKSNILMAMVLGVFGVALLGSSVILITRVAESYATTKLAQQKVPVSSSTEKETSPKSVSVPVQKSPSQQVPDEKQEIEDPEKTDGSLDKGADVKSTDEAPPSSDGQPSADRALEEKPDGTAAPVAEESPEGVLQSSAISALGPWRIILDNTSYKPDSVGMTLVGHIAALLGRDPNVRLKLVGITHISKSSKKARYAARMLQDRIIDMESSAKGRLSLSGDQSQELDGTIVDVSVVGGAQ